tara:strand:+ start:722 stop:901 length:180 start_codon:yes stop_codon:yes gene_type:complete
MQDFFKRSRNLRTPPHRFNSAVGRALTLFNQETKLFFAGLTDQIERILHPEPGHDVNVA